MVFTYTNSTGITILQVAYNNITGGIYGLVIICYLNLKWGAISKKEKAKKKKKKTSAVPKCSAYLYL